MLRLLSSEGKGLGNQISRQSGSQDRWKVEAKGTEMAVTGSEGTGAL